MYWLSRWRAPILLYLAGVVVFGAVAGRRLARQSTDPHFVYLADAWLHGRLAITDPPPPKGDDWAKVETVELDDGRRVSGRRMATKPVFQIAGGERIPVGRITRSVDTTHYVSFPPFPALLMLPQAAQHGRIANDVVPTVLVAALALPLMLLVLARLREAGLSSRTPREELWLSAALGFGSVLFFSAVQGRVWFTAHVVAVALLLGYVWCAVEARHPALAGLLLGFATLTRVPLAFAFPLFGLEAWRASGGRAGLGKFLGLAARFAAPLAAIAAVAMIHNAARFADPLEFGHGYLAVRQQANMELHGMFDWSYLSRNLAVALALLPEFPASGPSVQISGHGLAIWVTTPLVLYALWPRVKNALHRPLALTIACVAVPGLLYQNSGWVQFGYRFSLDYLPLIVILVAIGGRPLGRLGRALIVVAVCVNLFGAITFARYPQYYRTDGDAYRTVIAH
jgi:hypothetical protein